VKYGMPSRGNTAYARAAPRYSRHMSVETAPNAEHIQFWNDVLLPQFVRFRSMFVTMGDAHSRGPMERAGLQQGMRALDIGCGFGETTLQLARLVGPTGSAVGTDCVEPMLEIGRADAREAGLANVSFREADAQTSAFEPEFDVAFARFGTMFFSNPVAAMRNIGTALVPEGRLLMIVWRPLEHNEFMAFAKRVMQEHLPPPPDDAPNCGPGPFSMADPGTVTAILTNAGYHEIAFEQTDATVCVGATVDDAIAFQLKLGPAAEIFRDAPEEAAAKRDAVEADLRAAIEPYARPDGVWMKTSTWAVSARRAP
jgi:ubiquinone/menaquinone biosynthesis C-methylase UbiE